MAGKNSPKNQIQTSGTQSRSWEIKKGNVSFSFTLRIDIKQDLKDFRDCLVRAIEEVDAQLASMKK